ncbi:uncharacterized, partial [Tachysurus ichikawai]
SIKHKHVGKEPEAGTGSDMGCNGGAAGAMMRSLCVFHNQEIRKRSRLGQEEERRSDDGVTL